MPEDDPVLHLHVGGQRVGPAHAGPGEWRFQLRAPLRQIRLRSRSHRPARTDSLQDGRLLGLCITRLTLQDRNGPRQIEARSLAGADGFHAWEPPGWIWTDGDAALPDSLFQGLQGDVVLTVHGHGLPHYPAQDGRREAAQALFRACLSLGENCDFAFAQSHFDAEPMDLLRWASTSAAQVCDGLRQGFMGIGSPEETTLVWDDASGEYRLIDPRYASFHTLVFARADAAMEAQIRRDGCRRLAFLRRKLLHDLIDGTRMAVFRTREAGLATTETDALHAALRRIGRAPLLVLHPARAPCDIDTVTTHPDGLFHGWFDADAQGSAKFDGLHRLCAQAWALAQARAAAA